MFKSMTVFTKESIPVLIGVEYKGYGIGERVHWSIPKNEVVAIGVTDAGVVRITEMVEMECGKKKVRRDSYMHISEVQFSVVWNPDALPVWLREEDD